MTKINKNQEELEGIIKSSELNVDARSWQVEACSDKFGKIDYKKGGEYNKRTVNKLVSAILSAGYVRLEDVELDEFKIAQILANKEYCGEKCAEASHAITSAKDIIKVKK